MPAIPADAASRAQEAFSNAVFRVYTHDDVIGVELGGALKNVMAVATGIVEGLGLGFNSRAALITRGLAEMRRLGEAGGAEPETFAGMAGMGDLIVTCWHPSGRNRRAGELIAQGKKIGHRQVVLTGALDFTIDRLMNHLGIDHYVANRLEFVNTIHKNPFS